jgi:hypothetical protein
MMNAASTAAVYIQSHTHTHIHAAAHTLRYTHTHAHTHTQVHTHSVSQASKQANAHTNKQTHSGSQVQTEDYDGAKALKDKISALQSSVPQVRYKGVTYRCKRMHMSSARPMVPPRSAVVVNRLIIWSGCKSSFGSYGYFKAVMQRPIRERRAHRPSVVASRVLTRYSRGTPRVLRGCSRVLTRYSTATRGTVAVLTSGIPHGVLTGVLVSTHRGLTRRCSSVCAAPPPRTPLAAAAAREAREESAARRCRRRRRRRRMHRRRRCRWAGPCECIHTCAHIHALTPWLIDAPARSLSLSFGSDCNGYNR